MASAGLTAATPTLLWNDEFNQANNTAPDATKWGYDLGAGGWGNNELETYTNSRANSFISSDANATDGKVLVIAALKDAQGAYTSARLLTLGKFSTTYGHVEARLKITSGKGLWPAFWMLGTSIANNVNWPSCGEIDIMEAIGANPATAYGTLHGPGYSGAQGLGGLTTLAGGATYNTQYHVFAIDWSPNQVVWSVDGTVYKTVTSSQAPGTWVFNNSSFFILLNLAVGGSWPGNPDGTTTFPAEYRIDYVRVYGLTPATPTAAAANAPSASQVNISWSAPTDLKGFVLTGYRIERATDSSFTTDLIGRDVGTGTTFGDSTVTGGTSYYYRVATISTGGVSDPTAAIAVSTPVLAAAPVFTAQPASATVNLGASVSFSVVAGGAPAPTFQWQKNGVPISGATGNSYSIASVMADDAGNYTAVATNSAGSATSTPASLAVIVPPADAVITITVE